MAVVVSITSAHADDFTQCSESFYGGVYPEFINTKLSNKTQALCMDGFAVMYSGVSRTPLWSAEYLDRKRLQQAKELIVKTAFMKKVGYQNPHAPHCPTIQALAMIAGI